MQTRLLTALTAVLLVSVCQAIPKHKVEEIEKEVKVEAKQDKTVAKRERGDLSFLDTVQNDGAWVRTCTDKSCTLLRAGEARAKASTLYSVAPVTGNQQLTKALIPTVDAVDKQMEGLESQKMMLENLQRQMNSLNSAFSKGEQIASAAKSQFAASMTKGITMPAAAPPSLTKASMAPSIPSSAAFAPKGASTVAATMQLEAAMCPLTMFELGKAQKQYAEAKQQMESSNAMAAMMSSQKNNLEASLNVAQAGKQAAEQQAQFNAKYAAEQKNRADMLENALALANAEKQALAKQKADLETALAMTQASLAQEKQTNAALTDALKTCNEDKAQLEEEKAALTEELRDTQDTLRKTKRDLEDEQLDHARTRRRLASTEEELDATEKARKRLEEAKQELEDELAETKDQLQTVTAERDQLQVVLAQTNEILAQKSAEKMRCEQMLAEAEAIKAQLSNQLNEAMMMLAAEKKAREELTETIMMVKAASEKVQEEVKRLQLENLQLQEQLNKLRAEQAAALALAAGCPPTYEKFGASCYKYVREKTQWKMAQEQCMKDNGNLVSIESKTEQAFLVNYLRRHGASATDAYALSGGYKQMNQWYWLESDDLYIGQTGPEYWFTEATKYKANYDCQAVYLRDSAKFAKWVGLPCYSAAPYTCEIKLVPNDSMIPVNPAEVSASKDMLAEAPSYVAGASTNMNSKEARFDDKYLHIGGFDYNANGKFQWLYTKDDVDLGETSWLASNPRGAGRRCLAFQTADMDVFGNWADGYCWVSLPFVCEIVLEPTF